jgi:uncharacterized protein (TIGR00730 family)
MALPTHPKASDQLRQELLTLVDRLDTTENGDLIQRVLETVLKISRIQPERLDWKILHGTLRDMGDAYRVFSHYRHVRKIAIFGSARTPVKEPAYQMAHDLASRVAAQGFMVLTGGGFGIMQAANQGASAAHSFGLNILLPFEQVANPFIADDRLIEFKYFFTRKLFFLRETDALAIFPGGFGTQDEAFESLTLIQTGRFGPIPVVLVNPPGDQYWSAWETYIRDQLLAKGLIGEDDSSIYRITDDLEDACKLLFRFYRRYHSCRYVGDRLVMRLREALTPEQLAIANDKFVDLLVVGHMEQTQALPAETGDPTWELPRLAFHFDQRLMGRLYQFIYWLNDLPCQTCETEHPEQK